MGHVRASRKARPLRGVKGLFCGFRSNLEGTPFNSSGGSARFTWPAPKTTRPAGQVFWERSMLRGKSSEGPEPRPHPPQRKARGSASLRCAGLALAARCWGRASHSHHIEARDLATFQEPEEPLSQRGVQGSAKFCGQRQVQVNVEAATFASPKPHTHVTCRAPNGPPKAITTERNRRGQRSPRTPRKPRYRWGTGSLFCAELCSLWTPLCDSGSCASRPEWSILS